MTTTLPVRMATDSLVAVCHHAAYASGWWSDLKTGEDRRCFYVPGKPTSVNIGEKLMLIVSEVSEAMEGVRKGLWDDHLPRRPMLEVELADALIRIADLAGGLGLDLSGAVAEKLEYNARRADHRLEARLAAGGKAF